MMAQEGISVSQTVDDHMREMEVDLSAHLKKGALTAQTAENIAQECWAELLAYLLYLYFELQFSTTLLVLQ